MERLSAFKPETGNFSLQPNIPDASLKYKGGDTNRNVCKLTPPRRKRTLPGENQVNTIAKEQ